MARWWGRRPTTAVVTREPVVLVEARTIAREVAYRRLAESTEPTSTILDDYLDHVGATS